MKIVEDILVIVPMERIIIANHIIRKMHITEMKV